MGSRRVRLYLNQKEMKVFEFYDDAGKYLNTTINVKFTLNDQHQK